MSDENDAEGLIQFLIEMGILNPIGYNENLNDEMYILTDKASSLLPELSKLHEKETNSVIFNLWQLNMLDVVFDENGEPLVSLNKNSTDEEKIKEIEDEELRNQLKIIVSIFSKRFNEG